MRVVVPYAGEIHPIAARALEEFAPDAELVDVSQDDHAYFDLLARLWSEGQSFLLVEHDVEINAGAIAAAESCRCPWHLSAYQRVVGVRGGALGFARFSAELIEYVPDLIDRAREFNEGFRAGWDWRHWKHLDTIVADTLQQAGMQFHYDPPAPAHRAAPWLGVVHHHWDAKRKRCLCGSPRREICIGRRHHAGDFGCHCVEELAAKPRTRRDPALLAAIRESNRKNEARVELHRRREQNAALFRRIKAENSSPFYFAKWLKHEAYEEAILPTMQRRREQLTGDPTMACGHNRRICH